MLESLEAVLCIDDDSVAEAGYVDSRHLPRSKHNLEAR
jgi:hypothetical protein